VADSEITGVLLQAENTAAVAMAKKMFFILVFIFKSDTKLIFM
jgi:hypothetical protein